MLGELLIFADAGQMLAANAVDKGLQDRI